jgi:hypothetical protein
MRDGLGRGDDYSTGIGKCKGAGSGRIPGGAITGPTHAAAGARVVRHVESSAARVLLSHPVAVLHVRPLFASGSIKERIATLCGASARARSLNRGRTRLFVGIVPISKRIHGLGAVGHRVQPRLGRAAVAEAGQQLRGGPLQHDRGPSEPGPFGPTRPPTPSGILIELTRHRPMTDARKEIRRLKEKLTGFSSELSALESLLGGNDAPSILTKVRFITEKLLQAVCLRNDMKWGEGPPTIERMIGPLIARGAVPSDIALFVRTIQTHASPGSHYQRRPLSLTHVNIALEALIKTLEWYFTSEDPHVLPRSEPAHGSTTQRIRLIGAIGVAVLAVLAGTILWLHKVQSAQGLRLREHMVAFINAAHSLGEYSGKSAKERADIMRWSLNQADEILGGGGIGPQSIPGLEAIAQSPGGNAVGTRVV